jgi:hypothetical protein
MKNHRIPFCEETDIKDRGNEISKRAWRQVMLYERENQAVLLFQINYSPFAKDALFEETILLKE